MTQHACTKEATSGSLPASMDGVKLSDFVNCRLSLQLLLMTLAKCTVTVGAD